MPKFVKKSYLNTKISKNRLTVMLYVSTNLLLCKIVLHIHKKNCNKCKYKYKIIDI